MSLIKNKLRQTAIISIAMLALLLANPVSVFATSHCQVDNPSIQEGIECATPTDAQSTINLGNIIQDVVNILLFIVGIASVIMLIVGGIRFVISSGDSNQVQAARNTIIYAVVGIVVAFLAFALVNFVIGRLGGGADSGVPTTMLLLDTLV